MSTPDDNPTTVDPALLAEWNAANKRAARAYVVVKAYAAQGATKRDRIREAIERGE